MPYTFDVAHGPGVSGASAPINNVSSGDKVIEQVSSTPIVESARAIQKGANFDASELGEYIRDYLNEYSSSANEAMNHYIDALNENSEKNSMLSQSFAREQMEYQKQSDQYAMAWSAQEAAKNREWQERLSNTAHQREVKDLIAAGLNPILSANAGAYTGSGATGQSFSSSGAQGSVDSSTNALGSLYSGSMNSANNLLTAKLYTDAEKYNTDMQYAMAKLGSETTLMTNMNTTSAQKAIADINRDSAIKTANIHSSATLGAASMSAEATRFMAEKQAEAAIYGYDVSKFNTELQTMANIENNKRNNKIEKYKADKQFEAALEAAKRKGLSGDIINALKEGWNSGMNLHDFLANKFPDWPGLLPLAGDTIGHGYNWIKNNIGPYEDVYYD